jgi:hypothetical protein
MIWQEWKENMKKGKGKMRHENVWNWFIVDDSRDRNAHK